jgi:hypothetical protein
MMRPTAAARRGTVQEDEGVMGAEVLSIGSNVEEVPVPQGATMRNHRFCWVFAMRNHRATTAKRTVARQNATMRNHARNRDKMGAHPCATVSMVALVGPRAQPFCACLEGTHMVAPTILSLADLGKNLHQ